MTINRISMKKIIYIVLLYIVSTFSLSAQNIAERVYVSTDKEIYLAGEKVWMSGFCFKNDGKKISLSDISSLAYVEIYALDKPVLTLKMALKNGRGSAWADLPLTMSTGNYKIIAYTHYMQNEKPLPYFEKTISIYNSISSERLSNTVIGKTDSSFSPSKEIPSACISDFIEIDLPLSGVLARESHYEWSILNKQKVPLTLSVSVFKTDSLLVYNNNTMEEYLESAFKMETEPSSDKFIPEYEGEVIKGKIAPVNGSRYQELAGHNVFISFPGGNGELYASKSGENGEVVFYTDNVYGKRECVLEVVAKDTTAKFIVELTDPFIHPQITPAENLMLLPSYYSSLEERSIGMQLTRRFAADSLFETAEPIHNPLFSDKKRRYMLDDYTRFPVMEEVIIEYVYELRARKSNNSAQLLVRWDSDLNASEYSREHTLALVDGIPVFNHKKILDMDPLKVKSLEIYGDKYFIGNLSFTGIASFNTYNSKYTGLTFDKSVRIVDFEGAKPSSRLVGKGFETGKYPDFRHTLLWEPVLELMPSEVKTQSLRTSAVPGLYKIVIQGITESGESVLIVKDFRVE